MNPDYLKLVRYVNAATDMAEALEADIKSKSRKVSDKTILALSKFISAAHAVQKLLDEVEATKVKLQ